MMDHNYFCTFAMLQSEEALTAISPILKFGQTPYVSYTIISNLTDILLPFAVETGLTRKLPFAFGRFGHSRKNGSSAIQNERSQVR